MSMIRALAMLGSGVEAYTQGQEDAAAQKRLADTAAYEQQQRQFQLAQNARVMQQQAALAQAAAPVAATPDTPTTTMADGSTQPETMPDPSTDSIDVGQPGTAPALPAPSRTSTVLGQTGLNPMQTKAALAAANSPQAVAQRQDAALVPFGIAGGMEAAVAQRKLAGMQVANAIWNNDVGNAVSQAAKEGSPDALAQFMSDSGGDGQGGNFKAKAVVSQDGSTFQIMKVMPDGSLQPAKLPPLPNNATGYQQIALGLARMPIEQQMDHALALSKEARESKLADAAANKDNATAEWMRVRPEVAQNASGVRAAQFNEKEWNDAHKADPNIIGWENPLDASGKPIPDNNLMVLRGSLVNELRTAGSMSPQEAANTADAAIVKLKSQAAAAAAAAKLADPDSTLTPQQAAETLVRQFAAAKAARTLKAQNAGSDPIGLRGDTTTRPATPLETVQQDMAKNGIKDATATIAGPGSTTTTVFGKGATPPATVAPPSPPTAPVAPQVDFATASARLASAQAEATTARQALTRYGFMRRGADPQGYAAAQAADDAAQAKLAAAQRLADQLDPGGYAAPRVPRPAPSCRCKPGSRPQPAAGVLRPPHGCIAFAACTTVSEVVPTGKDTYMVSSTAHEFSPGP